MRNPDRYAAAQPVPFFAGADPAFDTIEALPVSRVWKDRFHAIYRAGGPALISLKTLPAKERRQARALNAAAFLFGPFYYLAKGMWRKGLVLLTLALLLVSVLNVLLVMAGYPQLGSAISYGAGAIYAVRANGDYYKKMVLNDNGWW